MLIEDILTDSGRATADMAVDVISQKPELFSEAYDLCMAQEGKMAMRSARVVWLVAETMPELFKPYFSDMVIRKKRSPFADIPLPCWTKWLRFTRRYPEN